MGVTSSQLRNAGAPLYAQDPDRFVVTGVQVYDSKSFYADGSSVGRPNEAIVVNATPLVDVAVQTHCQAGSNSYVPVNVRCARGPVNYIESLECTAFPLTVKVPFDTTLYFRFQLRLAAPACEGLTFIAGSSFKQLDKLITTEFFHNPNLQNEDNVFLIGNITPDTLSLEFIWKWSAPDDNAGPYNTVFKFAEYNKRDHALSTVAQLSLVVDHAPQSPRSPLSDSQYGPVSSPMASDLRVNTSGLTAAAGDVMSPVLDGSGTWPAPATKLDHESINNVLEQERQSFAVPRPELDASSQPGDGPLFRATISNLEKRTASLKAPIKTLLKRAQMVHERQLALVESLRLFNHGLRQAADSDFPSFKSVVYHYYQQTANGNTDLIEFLRIDAMSLHARVIESLRKFYELEIKTFDGRKREFDDQSSQYYAWLSRYLSMKQENKSSITKKKIEASDSKYLEKKRTFELCRFDYYSYMQDLNGGRKQQQVTAQLALHAEAQASSLISVSDRLRNSVKPSLDDLVNEVKDANKDWTRLRTEREDRRRALERSIQEPVELSPVDSAVTPTLAPAAPVLAARPIPAPALSTSAIPVTATAKEPSPTTASAPTTTPALMGPPAMATTATASVATSVASPTQAAPAEEKDESAMENPDSQTRKEGLLWANSRPGGLGSDPITSNLNKASSWHKFWVVLAGGKLCEYTNWKQGLDLHNEPIDLKMACVREARNSDRRFCFVVVTPSYKRVYQATNEEDLRSWIRSINNGITTSLETETGDRSTSTSTNGSSGSSTGLTNPGQALVSPKAQRVSGSYDLKVVKTRGADDDQSNAGGLGGKISRRISLHKAVAGPGSRAVQAEEESMRSKISSMSGSNLLTVLRNLDHSNQVCADCRSKDKVEWVSINLLVVLCIDCSGVHRSLGSHMSKIRSLTLDTVSFTPELIALLTSVNNRVLNSVWEQRLGDRAPVAGTITASNRVAFVTEKYVEKKFVEPLERPNAHLRQSILTNDLLGVIHALASRANADATVNMEDGTSENMLTSALVHSPADTKKFPLAELLLLNSASLPTEVSSSLPPDAQAYLARKIAAYNK